MTAPAPRPVRSTRAAVALAAAAAVGAAQPSGAALSVGIVVTLAWCGARHPLLATAAVALVASGLAQRSLDGLDGVIGRPVVGAVTLITDPVPSFGGVRADVRWAGRRFEAQARGPAADRLRDRLAGEVVSLHATIEPLVPPRPWLVARHVAGRMTVHSVDGWRPGHLPGRVANSLRRTLDRGAATLDDRSRSLYLGLVVGDDRGQPPDLADAFQGAGLTHLLAVSGQNVAFVLVLAGPVLRRLRIWPRLLVTLALIGLFGVMTRFEPSVLRASAMAALATTLATAGDASPRVRVLALAVTGLVLVDPLLVRSVGFQLSVAASLAIVVVAPRLSAVLPGPRPLREALGVTVAAQLGVAPVLLHTFGPIPVASVPANLLAVPVAGRVMVWGLTAGLLAGVLGDGGATLVHLPTRVALWWLERVAGTSARAGLGELGWPHLLAAGVGLGLAVVAGERAVVRRAGLALAGLTVAVAVVSAQAPAPLRSALRPGVVRWHAENTDVVVLGGVGGRSRVGPAAVLEALRRDGVTSIDLLVVADASVEAGVVAAVRAAHPTDVVVAQPDVAADLPAVVAAPVGGATVDVGGLRVHLMATPDRLVVDAARLRDRGG